MRKLLTTDDYRLMEEAAAAENWQEVLRYAHNLKGVCATLGLTGLQAQFADIVSLLLNLQSLMTANQLLCSTAFSLNLSLLSSSASTSSTVVRTN